MHQEDTIDYNWLESFSDAEKVSMWAIPAMQWAASKLLIQWRTGKQLAPQEFATRAEVAVLLLRSGLEVDW